MQHSWLAISPESDFSLQNLPLGIARSAGLPARLVVAVGEHALDVTAAVAAAVLPEDLAPSTLTEQPNLNAYLAEKRHQGYLPLRKAIQLALTDEHSPLRAVADSVLLPMNRLELLMPVHVPDYTDFYASETHATNVGKLFRPDNPLMPNWKHLPVGYHGRASSIVVSGTPIHRPHGQRKPPEGPPSMGPTQRLDYELEMAVVVDTPNPLGSPVSLIDAEEHIFGYLLFNDWSARDIQAWEYQPLGPFLGKNFASTVSPWLVPRIAMEPLRVQGPLPSEPLLPYLQPQTPAHLDIPFQVIHETHAGVKTLLSTSNSKDLYWSFAQMLAHHTVNGCNLRVGDLLASGTISSPGEGNYGCLLELTQAGKSPINLADGTTRTFLEDGDTLILTGGAETPAGRVGFGPCAGTIVG